MEVCERSEIVLMEIDGEECCTTPKWRECRIPETFACPPPPRKKPAAVADRPPPKNGYFQLPDLDSLFVAVPSSRCHQACA